MTLTSQQQNALAAAWHLQRPLQEIAGLLLLTTLEVREEASALQLPAGPMTGAARFTPDEVQAFRAAWQMNVPNRTLATRFCLKLKNVDSTAKTFGLSTRPYVFTEAEQNWIDDLLREGHSRDKIAKVLGIARYALRTLPNQVQALAPKRQKEILTHYAFVDDSAIAVAVSMWGKATRQVIATTLDLTLDQFTQAVRSVHPSDRMRLFPKAAYRNGRPAYAVVVDEPAPAPSVAAAVPNFTNPWWADHWSVCSVADVFGFRYATVMKAAELLGGSLTFAGTHLLALLGILADGWRRGTRGKRRTRLESIKRTRPLHSLFQFGHVVSTSAAVLPSCPSGVAANTFLKRFVLGYQVREVPCGDSSGVRHVVDVEIDVLRTLARLRPRTAWTVRGVIPARICVVLTVLR
jgi:hypothetical protein